MAWPSFRRRRAPAESSPGQGAPTGIAPPAPGPAATGGPIVALAPPPQRVDFPAPERPLAAWLNLPPLHTLGAATPILDRRFDGSLAAHTNPAFGPTPLGHLRLSDGPHGIVMLEGRPVQQAPLGDPVQAGVTPPPPPLPQLVLRTPPPPPKPAEEDAKKQVSTSPATWFEPELTVVSPAAPAPLPVADPDFVRGFVEAERPFPDASPRYSELPAAVHPVGVDGAIAQQGEAPQLPVVVYRPQILEPVDLAHLPVLESILPLAVPPAPREAEESTSTRGKVRIGEPIDPEDPRSWLPPEPPPPPTPVVQEIAPPPAEVRPVDFEAQAPRAPAVPEAPEADAPHAVAPLVSEIVVERIVETGPAGSPVAHVAAPLPPASSTASLDLATRPAAPQRSAGEVDGAQPASSRPTFDAPAAPPSVAEVAPPPAPAFDALVVVTPAESAPAPAETSIAPQAAAPAEVAPLVSRVEVVSPAERVGVQSAPIAQSLSDLPLATRSAPPAADSAVVSDKGSWPGIADTSSAFAPPLDPPPPPAAMPAAPEVVPLTSARDVAPPPPPPPPAVSPEALAPVAPVPTADMPLAQRPALSPELARERSAVDGAPPAVEAQGPPPGTAEFVQQADPGPEQVVHPVEMYSDQSPQGLSVQGEGGELEWLAYTGQYGEGYAALLGDRTPLDVGFEDIVASLGRLLGDNPDWEVHDDGGQLVLVQRPIAPSAMEQWSAQLAVAAPPAAEWSMAPLISEQPTVAQVHAEEMTAWPVAAPLQLPLLRSADGSPAVVVRKGGDTDSLARSLQARAFTLDGEIHIPSRTAERGTREVDAVVAHEMTHILQQRALGGRSLPPESSPAGRAFEAEALANEHAVRNGLPLPPALRHIEHIEAGPTAEQWSGPLPLATPPLAPAPAVTHAPTAEPEPMMSWTNPAAEQQQYEPHYEMIQRAAEDTAPDAGHAAAAAPNLAASLDDQQLSELFTMLYPLFEARMRSELRRHRDRAGHVMHWDMR